MMLLMRSTGLRTRDAVTLERHRLHGDSLLRYQAKGRLSRIEMMWLAGLLPA
jgi:hypothetical protein